MTHHSLRDRGGNRAAYTTPAMLGGPVDGRSGILTLRWLGTSNFELTFGNRVILLDCFYDRGPRMRPLGFEVGDVQRAHEIFIGHPHYDHISDAAQVAIRTGTTVIGHAISAEVVTDQGLSAEQVVKVTGLGDGDLLEFDEYRVRVIHGLHLSADEDKPDPRPNIDALREARESWESDLGPLSPEESAHLEAIKARGSHDRRVLEEATMCMVFEIGDFRLVYRDSAGPISQEERAYFNAINGVDAAIVGFIGRPLMRRQLDERTMPLVELYAPKVLMAAHHDDLYPVFLDMATEPLKMAVSHLLPGTETVAPVYLEPISMDISTGRVVENRGDSSRL